MPLNIDFGKTASDYGRFRAGFPDEFFDRVFAAGIVRLGDKLLDIGTGTGTLARGFSRRGCVVTALDRSRPLLDEAVRLAREGRINQIQFVEATAERTGLPDGSFDVLTAGQCWHWFARAVAAKEARRVLRASGRIILAHFDWIALPGNVVAATESLIEQHNPQWKLGGGSGLHPRSLADLAIAGFTDIETHSFDQAISYTHEAWRGRVRANGGVGGSLPPEAVSKFDIALADLLRSDFPEDPLFVPHRIWWVTAVAPPR